MTKLNVLYMDNKFTITLPVNANTKHFTLLEIDEDLRILGSRLGLEFVSSEEQPND